MKKIGISLFLLMLLLSSCSTIMPADQKKVEVVDTMIKTLEDTHPNPYTKTSRKDFHKAVDKLKKQSGGLDESSFILRLQELVALVGDSHTTLSFSSYFSNSKIFPLGIVEYDAKPIVYEIDEKGREYLGWEVVALNGLSMKKAISKIGRLVSHDNQIELVKGAYGYLPYADILSYLGICKDKDTLILTLKRGHRTVSYPLSSLPMETIRKTGLACLSDLSTKDSPVTARKRTSYFLTTLKQDTAYFQYNRCKEDSSYPMKKVVQELTEMNPSRLLIDLRYNGGGSDGVLQPVLTYITDNPQLKVITLVGKNTFSSAIINAIQLKESGAILVGQRTSGNVDHFGSVSNQNLMEGVTFFCSTKDIKLSEYFNNPSYKAEPLTPDVLVIPSLEAFLEGTDDTIQAALQL
ncbi:MAG: hypothetical protein WC159_06490 [Sphaerochaetaceae bacterium]